MAITEFKKVLRNQKTSRLNFEAALLARMFGGMDDGAGDKVVGFKFADGTVEYFTPEGGDYIAGSLTIQNLPESGYLVVNAAGEVSVQNISSGDFWTIEVVTADPAPAKPFIIYVCDTSAGGFNVTLPNLPQISDFYRAVKLTSIDTEDVIVDGNGILINDQAFQIIADGGSGITVGYEGTEYILTQDSRGSLQNRLARSTGIVSGMTPTLAASEAPGPYTKIDISPGIFTIESPSDLKNPVSNVIRFNGLTDVLIPNLNQGNKTYVLSDGGQGVIFQTSKPTDEQVRTNPGIAIVTHLFGNGQIQAVNATQTSAQNPSSRLTSYMLDLIQKNGLNIGAVAGTLNITTTAGWIKYPGVENENNPLSPDKINFPSFPVSGTLELIPFLRSGPALSPLITDVPVGFYDDGSASPVAIPGSNNQCTIHRIYMAISGAVGIAYGQNVYSNTDAALTAYFKGEDSFVQNPILNDVALLIGLVIAPKIATDLTAADVILVETDRWGDANAGGAAVELQNLLQTLQTGNNAGGLGILDLLSIITTKSNGSVGRLLFEETSLQLLRTKAGETQSLIVMDGGQTSVQKGSGVLSVKEDEVTSNVPIETQANMRINTETSKARHDIVVDNTITGSITVTGTDGGAFDGVYAPVSDYYQRGTDNAYIKQVTAIWVITSNLVAEWSASEYWINQLSPIGVDWTPTAGSGNVNEPDTAATGGESLALYTNGDIETDSIMKADSVSIGANLGGSIDADQVLWYKRISAPNEYIWQVLSERLMILRQDGSLSLPFCDNGDILDDTDVVIKGYLDAVISGLSIPSAKGDQYNVNVSDGSGDFQSSPLQVREVIGQGSVTGPMITPSNDASNQSIFIGINNNDGGNEKIFFGWRDTSAGNAFKLAGYITTSTGVFSSLADNSDIVADDALITKGYADANYSGGSGSTATNYMHGWNSAGKYIGTSLKYVPAAGSSDQAWSSITNAQYTTTVIKQGDITALSYSFFQAAATLAQAVTLKMYVNGGLTDTFVIASGSDTAGVITFSTSTAVSAGDEIMFSIESTATGVTIDGVSIVYRVEE